MKLSNIKTKVRTQKSNVSVHIYLQELTIKQSDAERNKLYDDLETIKFECNVSIYRTSNCIDIVENEYSAIRHDAVKIKNVIRQHVEVLNDRINRINLLKINAESFLNGLFN